MSLRKTMYMGLVMILVLLTNCSNAGKKSVSENTDETPLPQINQGKKLTLDNTVGDSNWSDAGYSIQLEDESGENIGIKSVIHTEEGKDVSFIVSYSWRFLPEPQKPVRFHLSIYLDYEQIDFIVDNSTVNTKKHEMQVLSSKPSKVPVTIPASLLKGTHKLMVSVEYAEEAPRGIPSSFSFIYDLIVGERSAYKEPLSISDAEIIVDGYRDNTILINQNLNPEYIEGETINIATEVIKTSPGELVPLAVRFCSGGEYGILIITLHGEQVDIEGNKYLSLESKGNLMFKKTYIKAPDEKGEYVLCGHYISLPYEIAIPGFPITKVNATSKLKLVVE